MLHVPESRVSVANQDVGVEPEADFIDFDRMMKAARRQVWVVVAGLLVGVLLGVAYLMAAVPLYTASADILIDKGQSKLVDELSAASGVFQDEAEMLSQVELLKSKQLARSVVEQMRLVDNARFMAGNPSLVGAAAGGVKALVKGSLGTLLPGDMVDSLGDGRDPVSDAVDILQGNFDVERVGRTYVLRLSYTSADAGLAAQITRAYGDAYLDDQLQAKYDATKRASVWLQDRIAELRQQSFDADLKVQNFRNENNLITSGPNGRLVSEQQLGEITTALIKAQGDTAEAKARLDQIQAIIRSGRTDAVVNDALDSSTITTMRDKYLDASRREAEISKKLGPAHIQAVRLRNEMGEYERLIFGELRRIAESYESTYKVAQSRQASLQTNVDGLTGVSATNNTAQVQLRQLERESETFKTLYDNFLQRFQQNVQQQSFPVNDARVITAATPPETASFPRKPLVLALFVVLGIGAGSSIGALREYRDRFFRTGDQVRSELHSEFLGFMPAVSLAAANAAVNDIERNMAEEPGGGLWRRGSVSSYVRTHPLSSFAETLRNVKVAADLALPERHSKVIGVVSCVPAEGKSTVSANLGILLAMQGARVLLIDGDLRNPGLTRGLERKPEGGLIEAVLDPSTLQENMKWDASGRLAVLPAVLKRRVSHTSELMASPSMAGLLVEFRSQFDYIVVDLPPIGPVVDAKAFAKRVDAFVFVVEWGQTSRQLVRSMMESHPVFHEKCLGVILNKSDETKMKLYRSYGSAEYYSARYSSYYHS